jgi:hypothetical protein
LRQVAARRHAEPGAQRLDQYNPKEIKMIYAMNYDLKRPGQNYEPLYEAIKGCGTWWHHLGSTWLVDTSLTASGIWERLAPHVDKNDSSW